MKVLMFSSDPENPRLAKYAEVLDRLEIIDFSRKRGRFRRFWDGYRDAKRILKKEKFDLITEQEIEHALLVFWLSRQFGIPWQMQIHTDIFSPYFARESLLNMARVRLAKFLIPKASCIRVVSERIKKSIIFLWPDLNVEVLPICSDLMKDDGSFVLRKKYPGYDFYILMIGRLSHEKNYPLAFTAMRKVIKEFPQTLLVIVGDGVEREKLEGERLLGLEVNVVFEGLKKNLKDYYKSSDVFLLTSNYEGYGMAAAEAISSGLPVIMTDVGLAGEVVKNGENGIIIPVGSNERLIEAISRTIREKDLLKKLREGALATKFVYSSFEDYRAKLIESFTKCPK